MCNHALIPSRRLFALFTFLAGFAVPVAAATQARLSESYGKLPLHFEANRGQTHEDVRFLARGPGYGLYLTAGEAVLVLTRPGPEASPGAQPQGESVALRMALVGAAPAPLVSGVEQLPGKANYFIGKDPARWRTNVPTYAKVHYREVYPGIDLVYYGNQRQLEYDFVVAPGADPKRIVLGFKGAEKIEIDAQGDLVLHAAGGAIRQHKPVVYQEIDGIRQEVAGRYVRKGANRVGFKVAAYDRSRPLVVDPVLAYSTYLGGNNDSDAGRGIAVDANGNAYVTGYAGSIDFPTTAGAFQPTHGGGYYDVSVTKLNATGSVAIYSTYLGGSGGDIGNGIAVDSSGNAYVTGSTGSDDFPTTVGAFQPILSGSDAFVAKLNAAGSALAYSTYLGGSGLDGGNAIAVDLTGAAYVTGFTQSADFPTTPGAFANFGSDPFTSDAFVTKLNPAGSALDYSTCLGGKNGSEGGNGIAVDSGGNAYVAGRTSSGDFPTTVGAFQPIRRGQMADGFVTKLNPTGSALVYSTYLGGNDFGPGAGEAISAIAVDGAGSAYVAGYTNAWDFPTTVGAYQSTNQTRLPGGEPGQDAFVTKLHSTGSVLVYSTYLGGSSGESGSGIAVDADGNAYVTGSTRSTDFPTTQGAFQAAYGGGAYDGYVTKLNATGSALVYSTYLGGSSSDWGDGIAVDNSGNAYATGNTNSPNFPTTPGAFQSGFENDTGHANAFVAKIVDMARFEESAATYSGHWPSYGSEIGTFSGGSIVAANHTTASATFSFTGTAVSWIGVKCNVCGIAMVSIDGSVPTPVDTFGPGVPGSLTSEPVFSASGLAPEVTHTLVITVSGATATTSPLNLLPGNGHVAVDAFDVTR
jgi:hypothetical protein